MESGSMSHLYENQEGVEDHSNYDPYISNIIQKYWHNHARIRNWIAEVDRTYEGHNFAKHWYWQMAPNQMYQAAVYMERCYNGELYANGFDSFTRPCFANLPQTLGCESCNHIRLPTARKRTKRARKSRRRASRCKHSCPSHHSVSVVELSQNDNNVSDGVEFEFEMSDELLAFFKQTAEHRKERALVKASQNMGKKQEDRLLDLEIACSGRGRATVLPPSEQKGALRVTEMRQLYGGGAAMIQGMETAMQLNFDRNTDRHKPRLWPALPLNIQFDQIIEAEVTD